MKIKTMYEITEDEVETETKGRPNHIPTRDLEQPCVVVKRVK
jgi:nitrogen fixation protein